MKNSTVKNLIFGGINLLAGFGIGVMAKTAGGYLTPETAGKLTKIACKAGTVLLASAAGRVASNELTKIDQDFTQAMKSISESFVNNLETEEEDENED